MSKTSLTEKEREVVERASYWLERAGFGDELADREGALLAIIERLDAELARLQSALPKTADGVTVVPGMKIYPRRPLPDVVDDHGIIEIGMYDPATKSHNVHGCDDFRVGLCYSTREAAEAAQQKGASREV